jgi:hypothetical protein
MHFEIAAVPCIHTHTHTQTHRHTHVHKEQNYREYFLPHLKGLSRSPGFVGGRVKSIHYEFYEAEHISTTLHTLAEVRGRTCCVS